MSQASFEIQAPAKIFLLGEYSVLAGGTALVATSGPCFKLKVLADEAPGAGSFHPESPAGKLAAWVRQSGRKELSFQFHDPFGGAGGFGASSAQFLLSYIAYARQYSFPNDWLSALRLYRELADGSGSDLVAQAHGGVITFNPETRQVDDLADLRSSASQALRSVLVFSAAHQPGRKVATHQHLRSLGKLEDGFVAALKAITRDGEQALREGDVRALGLALTAYGDELARAGLECEATRADRAALRGCSGVLGLKGTGALQADALLVACSDRAPVIEAAEARGLRLVCDGILSAPGAL